MDAPNSSPRSPRVTGKALRLWLRVAAAVAILAALAVAITPGRVVFAQDVELVEASVAGEAAPGGKLAVSVRLRPTHPLDADYVGFVHVEAPGADASKACRLVTDLVSPSPSRRWGDQEVTLSTEIPVGSTCTPGTLDVYVGLYNQGTWTRLKTVEPPTLDGRLLVGQTTIVAADPVSDATTVSARTIRRRVAWAPFRLLAPWILGAALSAIAAWLVFRRRAAEDDEANDSATDEGAKKDDAVHPWIRRLAFAAPAIPFFLGILVVLEFVKDDAYISFRYAHNLVTGHGLVFNTGERLEGFTNFLWVLILAPFEALGWDLFQVCEVLGTALGITCLVVTGLMTEWMGSDGRRRAFAASWGSLWLATSSSFVLWAKSGLEQPLASLLPIASAFVLWRARARAQEGAARGSSGESDGESDDARERRSIDRRYLAAGLMMGAGAMTRPELHLLAILVALPIAVDILKRRRITRAEWLYAAGVLAITVPCHTFRYLYYGTIVPNTFYVKTGTGPMIWREGIKTLRDMMLFNHTGLLAVLAPLAFADRRRRLEKATMAIVAVAFMVYYVKVGVDEMQWHRLYLPALPFLCVLAALGLKDVVEAVLRFIRRRTKAADDAAYRSVAFGVAWALVIVAAIHSFRFTYDEQHGFDGHGDLAGTFHPDLGKFLVRHERPGALVAFQDMGSTPYHAPDINFLDFFGLVDRTVAHARHDYGLHAFVDADVEGVKPKYDAEMREYFFRRDPEWAILTIYTPRGDEQRVGKLFEQDPTGGAFGDAYRDNSYQFDIWSDPRFRERYVPVRTWPRSASYYLALWRRRDLWQETPREVVLDAPPPGIAGARASFEGGLELLGSEMTKQTPERHEAFFTTWWKLPGPMPKDTYFFIHVTSGNLQVPDDHVPGDWMYPADRWKEGQVLEDRVLFQLPPFVMKPGTYSVYLGVYRRSTGERLKITGGSNDGQDRVLLGSFEATTLHPLVQQLIPPTRVDTMRKYPDRIVDSHRAPGT